MSGSQQPDHAEIRARAERVGQHIADLEWPETMERVGWYVALDHDWQALARDVLALLDEVDRLTILERLQA